jgi:hypothetical protein
VNRTLLTALAALLLGAGCPLPQPLPDYQRGNVTPPRIVMDGIAHSETIIRVPAGCPTEPTFPLAGVQLSDPNTNEVVVARWFVDYDASDERRRIPVHDDDVQPAASGAANPLLRTVPTYTYSAYSFDDPVGNVTPRSAAGILHVLELVVSAEFDDAASPPNRAPAAGFETQTYRWVYVSVPESATVTCP